MALSKAYLKYIKSPKWFRKRELVFERDNYQCQTCNAIGATLHCHHLTYDNLFDENLEDLITVCKNCHKYMDRIRKNLLHLHGTRRKIADHLLDKAGYPHDMKKNRKALKKLSKNIDKLTYIDLPKGV